jgi:hypothetical protein
LGFFRTAKRLRRLEPKLRTLAPPADERRELDRERRELVRAVKLKRELCLVPSSPPQRGMLEGAKCHRCRMLKKRVRRRRGSAVAEAQHDAESAKGKAQSPQT